MIHVFCNVEDPDDGIQPMCDMTFEIVETAYDEAGSSWRLEFRADATPDEPVGFMAVIPLSGWREQIDRNGDDTFRSYWGSITLGSCGIESDRLLALIAAQYGIPKPPSKKEGLLERVFGRRDRAIAAGWKFVNSIECWAVGINSDPALVAAGPVRLKLFLDDGIDEGRYAEVFLEIDMPQGFAALNEKDQDYRAGLVHWLSLPGHVIANPHASQAPSGTAVS